MANLCPCIAIVGLTILIGMEAIVVFICALEMKGAAN